MFTDVNFLEILNLILQEIFGGRIHVISKRYQKKLEVNIMTLNFGFVKEIIQSFVTFSAQDYHLVVHYIQIELLKVFIIRYSLLEY